MRNIVPFLDTISYSEGTWGIGDNGYNVLFGSTRANPKLFDSYADHPRIKTYETHDEFIQNGKLDFTTAAGKFQIIKGMFDIYKKRLNLPDFSPASQVAIATEMVRERKADVPLGQGYFEKAVYLCAPIWASLPGSTSGQRTKKMEDLKAFFIKRGGIISAGNGPKTTEVT